MIGFGPDKPHWPPSALADTLERVGDIMRLPLDWLWSQRTSDLISFVLFAANSFIWGFTLAVLFRLMLGRLKIHQESRIA